MTPEQYLHKRKLYDRYKKYIAYLKGYHYLEIPYWTEKNDEFKQLILNKVAEIENKNLTQTMHKKVFT